MIYAHRCTWPFLPLLFLLLFSQISAAIGDLGAERTFSTGANPLTGYSDEQPEFLPVTEAYPFQALIDNGKLVLHWDIEPGYYLYQERFRFDPRPAVALETDYPPGREIYDEYFEKNMVVYYSGVTLRFTLPADTAPFQLRVESQGCAEAGLCYPPHSEYLLINPAQGTVDTITFEVF